MIFKKISLLPSAVNVFQGIVGVLYFVVVARTLSVSEMGLFSFGMIVLSLGLTLTLTGFDTTINKAALKNDYRFIKKSLFHTFWVSTLLSLVVFFLIYFSSDLMGFSEEEKIFIYWSLGFVPFFSIDRSEHILIGSCRDEKIIFTKMAGALSLGVGALILFKLKASAIGFYIFFLFQKLFLAILGLFLSFKGVSTLGPQNSEKLDYRESYKFSLLGFFNVCLSSLRQIILYKISPEALALFAVGNKLPEKIKDYVKLIIIIPTQKLFRDGHEATSEFFKTSLAKLYWVAFTFSFLIGITLFFFLPIIVGDKYQNSVWITFLMSLTIAPKIIGCVLQFREILFVDSRFFIRDSVVQGLIETLLGFVLVFKFKEFGLCIASLVATFSSYYLSHFRLVRSLK